MPKRSEEQILEEESSSHLRLALSRYVVNPLDNDFGLDFEVTLTDEGDDLQDVDTDHFYVQLKSSQSFEKDDTVHWDLSTDHITQYVDQPVPVVLALYSAATEKVYWIIVQEYVWDILDQSNPDWARQQTCRINISRDRVLDNLDELERALNRTQSRITRRKSRGLNIGEGIAFTPDDFQELDTQIQTSRTEYKGHLLLKSRALLKRGEVEKAKQLIQEAYDSPEEDEGKLRSLLMQINMKNIAVADEAMEIVDLSQEAIELAQELGFTVEEQMAMIYKHTAGLFIVLDRQQDWQINETIQELTGTQALETKVARQRESLDLAALESGAASTINTALISLLEQEHYYEYAVCLDPLLTYLGQQLFTLYLTEQPEEIDAEVHPLIQQAEQLADFVPDPETEFNLRKDIGVYYYNHLNPELAEEFLTEAKMLAKRFDDTFLAEDTEELIERVRAEPNPYTIEATREASDVSPEQAARTILEIQGIDIKAEDDRIAAAARQGVEDADPSEYFEFCEHLHIAYMPSLLGRTTGVNSIGNKVLWCQHGGGISGIDLDNAFNAFKSRFCDGCQQHCPRSEDWEYSEDFFTDQFENDDFQTFLDNLTISPT